MAVTVTSGGPGFDLSMALQIATLLVALIGPILAYQYARKLAVSANRQAWLDALRADIAQVISLKDTTVVLAKQAKALGAENAELKRSLSRQRLELTTKIQDIRYRIRLRLRTGNARHDRLMAAIETMIVSESVHDRAPLRDEVASAAEDVVQHVWAQIERGR